MQYRRLLQRFRDWEQGTPRGRRAARLVVWFASILATLVSLKTLLLQSNGEAYSRYSAVLVTFEGAGIDANTVVRDGSEALPGILDVATFSLADSHIASLLVDTRLVSPQAVERRVRALIPPTHESPRSIAFPIIPQGAGLSVSFGADDARAAHERNYTRSVRAWLSLIQKGGPTDGIVFDAIPSDWLLKMRSVTPEMLNDGLARAFAPRPPLIAQDKSRLLASEWASPSSDASGVMERLGRVTMERPDGKEIALADVATISLRNAGAMNPTATVSPDAQNVLSGPSDVLGRLALEARLEADTPWRRSWSNVDWIVLALACASTLLVGFCSHRGAIGGELVLLAAFVFTFAAFLVVTPVADDFPLPQVDILWLCAGTWGFARTFPIRSRRGHAVRRRLLPFVCAALSGAAFLGSFRAPVVSLAQKENEIPSAFAYRLREKDKRLKERVHFFHGDSFSLSDGREAAPLKEFEVRASKQEPGRLAHGVVVRLLPTANDSPDALGASHAFGS